MQNEFAVGDLLLYHNDDSAFVVILDQVDDDYFTIVILQDSQYEYGFKIRIKNLTPKYFYKLDRKIARMSGCWERFYENQELLELKKDLKFNK
jgi:hypothetical protein